MKNVLLLKGQSRYDAMRNYIDEIEAGFRLAGFCTIVLDTWEESFLRQLEGLVRSVQIDIVFACNAINLARSFAGLFPHAHMVTYLCDHPVCHKERLLSVEGETVVFTCDALHGQYLREHFPNIKYGCFIPMSGSFSPKHIPYEGRGMDVVFTGSYQNPADALQDAMRPLKGDIRRLGEFMAKDIIANPGQALDECLHHALKLTDAMFLMPEYDEIMQIFWPIDSYARNYYRDKVIRTLIENDIPVHVYGSGWEDFESSHLQNLIIEKGSFYVARKAVANAKISLNVMPWFKAGFQERIATAMLSGTVAVTDGSRYLTENFQDGEELVVYSLENLDELPGKVRHLLGDGALAGRIAVAGRERAQRELTWQHRTFQMIHYIAQYVDPGFTAGMGEMGRILRISYPEECMRQRVMAADAISGSRAILDMLCELQDHGTVDVCDIRYLYSRYLLLASKLNANFPEVSISEFVDDYMGCLTEGNVAGGAELLAMACHSLQALFLNAEYDLLSAECSRLTKESAALKTATQIQGGGAPTAFDQEVLIRKLFRNYGESTDEGIQEILQTVKELGFVSAYNQSFTQKYAQNREELLESVHFDEKAAMHYVHWNGRRMYYPKSHSKEYVATQVNFVSLEQDMESPHRYIDGSFDVREGDIVIDAGVAEGNFALDVVERAGKLYLVECDPEWAEALRHTFQPWADKVVIIEKMLGATEDDTHISIDRFVSESEVNFIKMDVEGAELDSLHGASRVLDQSPDIRCAICCYHRRDAEKDIRDFLEGKGFLAATTDGYMFFKEDMDSWVDGELRHGVVRAVKTWGRNKEA